MRTYTEQEIRDAWSRTYAVTSGGHGDFYSKFLVALRAGPEKKPAMLFTRDELLAVAATEADKLIVHGIFAVCGTDMLNGPALMLKAKQANLGGPMEIMIRLARAKKEEDFRPGDVVRDANGIYRELTGNRMWATFRNPLLVHYDEPKRPLEKMP